MKKEIEGRPDRRRFASRCLLVLVVTFLVVMPIRPTGAQQANLADLAVAHASWSHNLPANRLTLLNNTWLAQKVYRAKVRDANTGDIYVVSLRASGEAVSEEEVASLIDTERERAFVGKLHSELKQKADADPGGSSSVIIWVKTPEVPHAAWQAAIEAGKIDQVLVEARDFHAKAEKLVLQFLSGRSIPVKYASPIAPIIEADVSNSLLPALEGLPQIARIYLRTIPKPDLDVSIPTIRAEQVWATGHNGSGVKVAIVESGYDPDPFDGISDYYSALPGNSPYLGTVSNFDTSSPRPSHHAAYVMGAIASTHATYKGVAYGVNHPIYCGNAFDTYAPGGGPGLTAATDWAVATVGARVVNQSWGTHMSQIGPYGMHDDYLIKTYLTTITCSSGNDPTQYVKDPANAYNVIGVGAFDSNCNKKWSNDIMAGYSSYINPISPHNDREKPEVVAPGNIYSTTEASPWFSSPPPGYVCPSLIEGGTSLAAPTVAGTVALLGLGLTYVPDVGKAVLMASATHNIEGSSRLSDQDGAGGINAKAAYDVLANNWADYRLMGYTYCLGSTDRPEFYVTAGQTVRAAISWLVSIDPNTGIYTFQDADLTVANPDGTQLWTSASFDNNYEIVEFVAPVTGTYRMTWCYKNGSALPTPRVAYAYYIQ